MQRGREHLPPNPSAISMSCSGRKQSEGPRRAGRRDARARSKSRSGWCPHRARADRNLARSGAICARPPARSVPPKGLRGLCLSLAPAGEPSQRILAAPSPLKRAQLGICPWNLRRDPDGSDREDRYRPAISTFALALEAQARGHALFYYGPRDLTFATVVVVARFRPLSVRPVKGDHFSLGDPCRRRSLELPTSS